MSQAVTPPPAVEGPPVSVVDDRLAEVGLVTKLLRRPELGALIGALAVGIFFAATADSFRTLSGMANWTDVASTLGIMAVVVALLMIGGEFDLSAGAMTGTCGLLLGVLTTEWGLSMWPGIIITFAFAALVGFTNGYMVMKTRLPSFIVTLATFFILQGINLGFTKEITGTVRVAGLADVPGANSAEIIFSSTFWEPHNFRISVIWWLGITLLATWVLARTRFGNWIFAAGGDANAARNVGVPVNRVKIILFMCTALSAALLATIQVLDAGSADVLRGELLELQAIAASVIGGVLLTGGYGSGVGAPFGGLHFGMVSQGIFFIGVSTDWFLVFVGVMLLIAVVFNNFIRRRASEAR